MTRSKSARTLAAIVMLVAVMACAASGRTAPQAAGGPLRVHPANPRYFTDGTGKAIYLTGSHTWGNLADFATWPPFDYTGYLDFLQRYNHNFIRLWSGYTIGRGPVPYVRSGPGTATDGQPRVDLDRFEPAFFDRLRSRVIAARDRGIYVCIMLFATDGAKREDWEIQFFHPSNNIQGIDADTNGDGSGAEVYDGSIARITAYQEAFARKVIDTVNDLDNVLYEIGNEGDLTSIPWQHRFVNFIRNYQGGRPKQHPVGMTAVFNILDGSWAPDNSALFNSAADWISPAMDPYKDNPPAANGSKVIIADVDHIWPTAPQRGWVWECFLRGIHPILMDWYSYGNPTWVSVDEQEAFRKYMGYTLTYANKMNLAAMTPRNGLSSTGYCLANPGSEYLVYQPGGGAFSVDLTAGSYSVEWFDPETNSTTPAGSVSGGGTTGFTPPFGGEALLYLKSGGGPGGDTTPPSVQITTPANGATVSGTVFFSAGATDDVGVSRVELFIDGTWVDTDSGPYEHYWDTTLVSDGSHTLTATAFDAAGNSASASMTVSVANGGGTGSREYLWLEAEFPQALDAPMQVGVDAGASGGQYVHAPVGSGIYLAGPGPGTATYTFTITQPGEYVVWGRYQAPAGNSFFVQMDDGSDNLWDVTVVRSWEWDVVSHRNGADPVRFSLGAGTHTIRFKQREEDTRLDKILITDDLVYVPSGDGGAAGRAYGSLQTALGGDRSGGCGATGMEAAFILAVCGIAARSRRRTRLPTAA